MSYSLIAYPGLKMKPKPKWSYFHLRILVVIATVLWLFYNVPSLFPHGSVHPPGINMSLYNCITGKPKMNVSQLTLLYSVFGPAEIRYGLENVRVWNDTRTRGITVYYPAGSYTPSSGAVIGGFGVVTSNPVNAQTAVFKYAVYFPKGFNFVLGGKLPGLYGGRKGCTGKDAALDCFSSRLMWREKGKGELYLYINRDVQDPAICEMRNNFCSPIYGWSLSTGQFTFKRGVWTRLEQILRLNTPGLRNGLIVVKVNGKPVIQYNNLVFRTEKYPNLHVEGMDVETFFGGNDSLWATPTRQYAMFKDFSLKQF